MNESTLKDLQQKVNNLLHDFEHEHELHGLMAVSREGNRLIIEAKEMTAAEETHLRALGGPVAPSRSWGGPEGGREIFVQPSSGRVIVPNESIYPSTITINATEGQAAADAFEKRLNEMRGSRNEPSVADALPLIDESGVPDTSPMTPPDHMLSGSPAQAAPLMNDGDPEGITRAVEEQRIKKATGTLSDIPQTQGYIYDDAPGMVFNSPDEHAAWQKQQTKRGRG